VQSVELGIIVRFEDVVWRPTPWRLYASCFWEQPGGLLACMHLEKPPPDEDDDDESETSNGPVLGTVSTQHAIGRSRRTCFNSSSQLIRTAAFLYFLLSSRSRLEMSPMRSRLSPLYSRSSMFLVMTFVTSLSSSLSLSRFWVARESWYVFFVRWMNVSNSTNW
jgi:hypothetical protein